MMIYQEEIESNQKKQEKITTHLLESDIQVQQIKRKIKLQLLIISVITSLIIIGIILFSAGKISAGLTIVYVVTILMCVFGLFVRYSAMRKDDTINAPLIVEP
jgi:uncharacterized membrane protein YiaA